MASKTIPCVGFMTSEDGTVRPMEELTQKEHAEWIVAVSDRGSRVMSEYYSNHLDEFERLPELSGIKKDRREKLGST